MASFSYHLRVRPDVKGEDGGRQGTEKLWAVPHRGEISNVVVKVPEELHKGNWILPEPGPFLLGLPRLQKKTRQTLNIPSDPSGSVT